MKDSKFYTQKIHRSFLRYCGGRGDYSLYFSIISLNSTAARRRQTTAAQWAVV